MAKKGTIQGYSIIEQASIQTNKTKTPYAEKCGYQGLPWITQIKVQQEIKFYFCILAHILSNIGSILIKCNVVCPVKLEKFNESNILQVSEIFLRVLGVFY